MSTLYLRGFQRTEKEDPVDPDSCTVALDLESVITLFIYEYLQRPDTIEIVIVEEVKRCQRPEFLITLPATLTVSRLNATRDALPEESQLCKLPVIVTKPTIISGLCNVCRAVTKLSGQQQILGFKSGCLAAPAEASVWTQYCEVDVIEFLDTYTAEKQWLEGEQQLDEEVARFEIHLKQPVRIHNHRKFIQSFVKLSVANGVQPNDPDYVLEKNESKETVIKHRFVEGPTMFLADLILYCVFYFYFRRLNQDRVQNIIPLTVKWFETMEIFGKDILDGFARKMVIIHIRIASYTLF